MAGIVETIKGWLGGEKKPVSEEEARREVLQAREDHGDRIAGMMGADNQSDDSSGDD